MVSAIIDATQHTADAPPSLVVAGITLIERALRLAAVCGCSGAVVVCKASDEALVSDLLGSTEASLSSARIATLPDDEEPHLHHVVHLADAHGQTICLRSSTVYDRGIVKDFITRARESAHPRAIQNGDETLDLLWLPEQFPLAASVVDFADATRALTGIEVDQDERWTMRVTSAADGKDAAHWLWQSCRKPIDGVVSTYLNRYISLAVSAFLAPTSIKPNHISYFTFTLGIVAGVLASFGGYVWLLAAGIVFQINSIIDGCDGELARVKYEFSVKGEWLDTLSDDLSDVFFWTGLGIGATRMEAAPWGIDNLWLWLAGISGFGKLASMALYYRWLIAHKRGDLLAFQWSFDEEDVSDAPLAKLLRNLRYVTKKDFIVFAAMVMGILGILPFLLFAAAPGNLVVASSVLIQEINNRASQAQ